MPFSQKLNGLTRMVRPNIWPGAQRLIGQSLTTGSMQPLGFKLVQDNLRGVGRPARQFWNGSRLEARNEPNVKHSASFGKKRNGYQEYEQNFPRGRPEIVVRAVVLVCTGFWAYHYYQKSEAQKGSKKARQALADFNKHMVLSLQNLREGRLYTILTHTFVHEEGWHLFANMFVLWNFGPLVVTAFGVPAFAVLWVGAGIMGGAAQSYFWLTHTPHAQARGLGASGSILGMMGALTFAMPKLPLLLFPIPVPMTLLTAMAIEVGFSIAAMHFDWLRNVGHADHLGGTAFGALWYLVALRRRV